MGGLMWDDELEWAGDFVRVLKTLHQVDLRVTSSPDDFLALFGDEQNPIDFAIVDLVYASDPRAGKPTLRGLDLAERIAPQAAKREIPVFMFSAQINKLRKGSAVKLPASVILKTKTMGPGSLADELVRELERRGVLVQRDKIFLVHGRHNTARTALIDFFRRDCGLSVDSVTPDDLWQEMSSDLFERMNRCGAIVALCTADERQYDGTYLPENSVMTEIGVALALPRGRRRLVIVQERDQGDPDRPRRVAALPAELNRYVAAHFAREVDASAKDKLRERLEKACVRKRPDKETTLSPLEATHELKGSGPMTDNSRLDGEQCERLTRALIAAFPSEQRLAEMLRYRLNIYIAEITTANGLNAKVFDLVQDAEARGYLDRLVAGARESNPGNPKLAAFAENYQRIATAAPKGSFEQMLDRVRGFMDAEAFYAAVGQSLVQVCRVEVGDSTKGTGFLIGPDLVMTNYHVIEAVREKTVSPDDVILRFDYRRRAGGAAQDGTEYRLAKEGWLVDSSPYSAIDKLPEPKSGQPAPTELDYAILKVNGSPGTESIGRVFGDPSPRGWMALARGVVLAEGDPLFIVQHPLAAPLKIDLHSYRSGHPTRVTYTVNTEPGSSGSPVFDGRFRLVALHHSSGPIPVSPAAGFNEGIPMDAICRLIEEHGHGEILLHVPSGRL